MTLFRQMLIIIISLLVFSFAGTFYFTQHYTQQYLREQLQSHAQDTATSLGLSLSKAIKEKDKGTMSSIINAIFDRGDYSDITLKNIKGDILVSRKQMVEIDDIPHWFINSFQFDLAPGSANIVSGWRQAGTVTVSSHPGYAYAELWNTFNALIWWYLMLIVVSSITSFYLLRWLFKPLEQIRQQAKSICQQEFTTIDELPHTIELRQVTVAMNTMSLKLKQLFLQQSEIAKQLQQQSYQDPITGLKNRRAFDNQLAHVVSAEDEFSHGYLLMFGINGLKKYNEKHGYSAGDQLLVEVAEVLSDACQTMPAVMTAHLSGGYFTILTSEVQEQQVQAACNYILEQLRTTFQDKEKYLIAHAGVVMYLPGLSAEKFLAASDMALRQAQAQSAFTWQLYTHKPNMVQAVRNASAWHNLLQNIIEDKNIFLFAQRCVDNDKETLYEEIFLRAKDERNEFLTAGQLMPLAERFDLALEMDKLIIESLLAHMQEDNDKLTNYVVNLSQAAITSSRFIEWLSDQFNQYPGLAQRITFELIEAHVTAHLTATKILMQRLSAYGCHFAVDHFGRDHSAFAYLASMNLAYIKLDGSYSRNIQFDKDSQFYISAIIQAAHTLDTKVFASHIETEKQWQVLKKLGIDGGQGKYIAELRMI